MGTTIPTQYSYVSLSIEFPILYHQTCHFSELQRCSIIFSNFKFLKPNLASFLCALALVLRKLKHYHSNASVSLTAISCPRSPSFTLVPQIYVKCQVFLPWVSQICHFLFTPVSDQVQALFALSLGTYSHPNCSVSKVSNLYYTAPQNSLSNLLSFYHSLL